MRKTAITFGLLVLSASTTIGCKSTPKLAWWKSNKADEAALAHAAPELPSDAAKKAEGTQVAGSAAPFKPANTMGSTAGSGKNDSAYPSTDAPAFTPNAVTQVAAATAPTSATTSTAAAGPYDPSATPAPKAPTTSVATTVADRYGAGAMPSAQTAGATPVPLYGQGPSGASNTVPSYPPTTELAGGASRYGSAGGAVTAPPASATTPAPPAYSPAPVTQASTQSYRPGGTSSYAVSVASLPPATSAAAPTTPTTVESGATTTPAPAATTAPTAPSGTNRYW
ncbi:hypothetical protein [Lacipirellula limnantheis]|uniref:Uncharacterized protein n=1 Tax=Lacipirellula limnantheis TaxID=2528024 RepID=A0A517U0A1_9BACT|nr:hypothetical protein [Lacipirellula limnantheis]QDT74056.1 hypothetical protein I41_32500 [Lacipirellula limnantheis]